MGPDELNTSVHLLFILVANHGVYEYTPIAFIRIEIRLYTIQNCTLEETTGTSPSIRSNYQQNQPLLILALANRSMPVLYLLSNSILIRVRILEQYENRHCRIQEQAYIARNNVKVEKGFLQQRLRYLRGQLLPNCFKRNQLDI